MYFDDADGGPLGFWASTNLRIFEDSEGLEPQNVVLSAARLRRAHFDNFEVFGLDFASRVRIAPGSRLGL